MFVSQRILLFPGPPLPSATHCPSACRGCWNSGPVVADSLITRHALSELWLPRLLTSLSVFRKSVQISYSLMLFLCAFPLSSINKKINSLPGRRKDARATILNGKLPVIFLCSCFICALSSLLLTCQCEREQIQDTPSLNHACLLQRSLSGREREMLMSVLTENLSLGDTSSGLLHRTLTGRQRRIRLLAAHSCVTLRIKVILGDNRALNSVTL